MIKIKHLEKGRPGNPLLGFTLTFPSPELVEFMGLLGFDYVFIDCEHYAFDLETIQSIIRAAELTEMLPIARVPKSDPDLILGYLETGVQGIVAPHVKTKEDAKAVVDAVKYYPLGKRGAGGRSRAAGYGVIHQPAEYFKLANERTIVILMIEEEEAIKNLSEILTVPGVDYLDFGPSDLALSMGIVDQSGLAQVKDAIKVSKELILNSSKGFTAPIQTVEEALSARAEGASLIEFNTNVIIQREVNKFLQELRSS